MVNKQKIFDSASRATSIKDNPYQSNPRKDLWECFYFQTRDYEIEKEMMGGGYESHSWGSYDENANITDSPEKIQQIKVYEDFLFFPSNNPDWQEQFRNKYLFRTDVHEGCRNRKGFDALSDWLIEDANYLRQRYKMLGQVGFPNQDPDFPCMPDSDWTFLNLIMELANVGHFEKKRLFNQCYLLLKNYIKKSDLISKKNSFRPKAFHQISYKDCPRFVELGRKCFSSLNPDLIHAISYYWDESRTAEEQDEEFLFFFAGRFWQKPIVHNDLIDFRINFSKWFNSVVERPCGIDAFFDDYWNKPFIVNYNAYEFHGNVFSYLWNSLVSSLKKNKFYELDDDDKISMLNYYISNKETWTSSKKFSEWKIKVTQNFDFDVFCYGVLEDQICTLATRLCFLCPHSETLNYWRRKMDNMIGDKFGEMVESKIRNNL